MQKYEIEYYESIRNWNFDEIRYESEKITNWDFYEKIKENTNENSICLDLGTGGGERVLKNYPNVGMIIATDFSQEMLKTAKENSKKYPNRNIKFAWMDNLEMTFPKESFNLISARHTIINAKQIYDCLTEKGVLVVEGVDKFDCWELKEIFNRGQAYKDKTAISEKDYSDLKNAGFKQIEKVKIFENEYYKTEKDLMALLLKAPILDNFLKIENKQMIEKDLFNKYVSEYKTEKGILLKRVLYGIVAKK